MQVWHSRHHQTQTVPLMGVRRPGVAQTEQQLAPKGNGPNMDPMDPQIPQLCHSAGVLARQIPPDSDCAHLWVFAGRARHNLSNNWLRREVVPAWVLRIRRSRSNSPESKECWESCQTRKRDPLQKNTSFYCHGVCRGHHGRTTSTSSPKRS